MKTPTPGLKSQLLVCPVSVGLKLMSCKGCPRPARDWCAGCRTLSRLKFLWTQQLGPFEDAPALNAFRECAGVLSDLAEVRSSFLRQPEGEAQGGTPGTTPVPPGLLGRDLLKAVRLRRLRRKFRRRKTALTRKAVGRRRARNVREGAEPRRSRARRKTRTIERKLRKKHRSLQRRTSKRSTRRAKRRNLVLGIFH